MDQGFNDDELADIMNEIESLEEEFTEETQSEQVEAKAEVEAEDAAQSEADDSEPETEQPHAQKEIVEELATKSDVEIEKDHQQAEDDHNVHALKSEDTAHHDSQINSQSHSHDRKDWGSTSMDFSVEGNMKMNMFFKVSGKTVHLHVNENAFEIELEGGMKFSIPVHEQSDKKAA